MRVCSLITYYTFILFSISLGVFTLVTVTLLLQSKETKSAAETMDDVFMVFFPHYCLGKSFINIYVRYDLRNICLNLKPTNIIQVLSSGGNWLLVFSFNSIDIRVPLSFPVVRLVIKNELFSYEGTTMYTIFAGNLIFFYLSWSYTRF